MTGLLLAGRSPMAGKRKRVGRFLEEEAVREWSIQV